MNILDDIENKFTKKKIFEEKDDLKEDNYGDIFSIMESLKEDIEFFKELSKDEKKIGMIIDMYDKEKEEDDKKISELEKIIEEYNKCKNKFFENLINILDQIDYIYKYSIQSNNENLKEHLDMTNKVIKKYIGEMELEEIECIGDTFDSKYHKGEGMRQDLNIEPEKIVEVIKKGYLLNGDVFRYASVVISK